MLKRVSIQNFKSLKDVTLDLQKVNLLIGPNNSGKTNFLKALEYFGKHRTNIAEEPDRNKISYAHNESNSINIQFKFEAQDQDYNIRNYIYYVLECQVNPNGSVIREKWYQSLMQPSVKTFDASEKNFSYDDLQKIVGPLIIYKPDPNRLSEPALFSADEILLKGDCSNLIPFLFYLNTNYKRSYQQIEKDLAECVRDIVSFSTPPVKVEKESRLGLKFFGRKDEDYWVEDVSEGVLYFLALLCIINQPNPPKLLLLEEPEKGIHPRRIREVMNFIRRLVAEKDIQVIMTTHSPLLLDEFAESPESVFVFDKDEDGATFVQNLQRDVIEPANQKNAELGIPPVHYTDALGEYWTIGFLGGIPHEAA